MAQSIVEKWISCYSSLVFGALVGDEAGYALREEGYNEHYGCEQPNIINSGRFPIGTFWDDGHWSKAAVLHGIGKDTDLEVIQSLTTACENWGIATQLVQG